MNSKNDLIHIPIMKVEVSSHYLVNLQGIHNYLYSCNLLNFITMLLKQHTANNFEVAFCMF